MILEKSLNKETLIGTISEFLNNPAKRLAMSKAAIQLGKPHAADDIAAKIQHLFGNIS